LKLYIGSKRIGGNLYEMINAHEEMQQIEAGRNLRLGKNPKDRYWKET